VCIHCRQLLKRDKTWNDAAAKALLLKIFETLGPQSDLAKKGRSRMTNLFFL
jgi:putative thioredoxin